MSLLRSLSCAVVCATLALATATAFAQQQQTAPATGFTAVVEYPTGSNSTVGAPTALMQGSDGNYYGTTAGDPPNAGSVLFELAAGTFASTVVHTFNPATEGGAESGVVEGPNGYLYGVTSYTGSEAGGVFSGGVFYSVSPSGAFTTIQSFTQAQLYVVQSQPVLGSDGNFYVTSTEGGVNGQGSIMQISLTGAYHLLFSFTAGIDEYGPIGALVETTQGTFYGTSNAGGANDYGYVYKMVVSGSSATVTDIHDFDVTDGGGPASTLWVGPNGNLYGMTSEGGPSNSDCDEGITCGTIFEITPSGTLTTLVDFSTYVSEVGSDPANGFLLASDGNFYGDEGEQPGGGGNLQATLWAMTPSGTFTLPNNTDGSISGALVSATHPMVQASDGTVLQSSGEGGSSQSGDVVKLTLSPTLKGPVQVTTTGTPKTNAAFTVNYSVANGFSTTYQQCYAYVRGGTAGAGTFTGKLTGTSNNSGWSGSAQVTPTTVGTYTYAVTCGGLETGSVKVTVAAGPVTTNTVVSVSPSPVIVGQAFNIPVTVTAGSAPVNTTDLINVVIQQGSNTIVTYSYAPDSSGQINIGVGATVIPSAGAYTVTASFVGDSTTYAPSSEEIGFNAETFSAPNSIVSLQAGSGEFFSGQGPIQGPNLDLYAAYSFLSQAATTSSLFTSTLSGSVNVFYTSPGNSKEGDFTATGWTFAQDGNLYSISGSTAVSTADTMVKITPAGQYSNVSPTFLGWVPTQVTQGSDGNLYAWGENSSGVLGIYEITPEGGTILINAFSNANWFPLTTQLVELTTGVFYGEAYQVDTGSDEIEEVDFSFNGAGAFTTLQDRTSNFQDLIQIIAGSDGNWYGLTDVQSVKSFVKYNGSGNVTNIHTYGDSEDYPTGVMILGSDGYFYALSYNVSLATAGSGYTGALVRIGVDGIAHRVATTYPGYSDPIEDVLQASDGNFYFAVNAAINGSGTATDAGDLVKVTPNPALPAPVQVSLSEASITRGQTVTVSWKVLNAFSATMQTCAASTGAGGGSWSGLQTGTLAAGVYSGSAILTPTETGVFSYALTCGGMETGAASLTVKAGVKTATTTTVVASPNPVIIGQNITLTATVAGSDGNPTGSVTFSAEGVTLATMQLSGGKAALTAPTTGYTAGTYPVIATYNGDTNNSGSASSAVNVVLSAGKTATTVTATTSKACLNTGAGATLNAQVHGNDATGTVVFSASGVTIGQGTLSITSPTLSSIPNFSLTTTGAPAGNYTVIGTYSGDGNNDPSTGSFPLIVMPNAAVTMFANPMTVASGGNVTFSVDVGCNGPVPTGTVKFEYSGINLEQVTLAGGVATSKALNSTGYPAGQYPITAVYSGDTNYPTATSAPVTITLQ